MRRYILHACATSRITLTYDCMRGQDFRRFFSACNFPRDKWMLYQGLLCYIYIRLVSLGIWNQRASRKRNFIPRLLTWFLAASRIAGWLAWLVGCCCCSIKIQCKCSVSPLNLQRFRLLVFAQFPSLTLELQELWLIYGSSILYMCFSFWIINSYLYVSVTLLFASNEKTKKRWNIKISLIILYMSIRIRAGHSMIMQIARQSRAKFSWVFNVNFWKRDIARKKKRAFLRCALDRWKTFY